MKKLTLTLTLLAATLLWGNSYARNVSVNEAKTAAAYFLSQRTLYRTVSGEDLRLEYQIDNKLLGKPACYFFNASDWGWIIMAANTAVAPVMAYGDEGANLEPDDLPENMMAWIQDHADLVCAYQNYEDAEQISLDVHPNWEKLLGKTLRPASKSGQHNIMVKTTYGTTKSPIKWHQNAPYNARCPQINGVTCVTGCVATALSQIVYYYGYPIKPTGTKNYRSNGTRIQLNFDTMSFDYSKMGPSVAATSTAEKKNEVAKLCYAVGVCMEITYNTSSSGGSGAFSHNVIQYMSNNFKYRRCAQITRSEVGNASFVNQIREELKLNRPVYMSGSSSTGTGGDSSGHAWVCCGYDDDDENLYYMNWGWGNATNGWYDLKNNGTGMYIGNDPYGHGYTFNVGQSAMIGLVPPHADSTDIDFIDHVGISSASENNSTIGNAYPNPAIQKINIPYNVPAGSDLTIYNVEGRIVKVQPLNAGEGNTTVDLNGMPAGIYTYRAGNTSGKFIVK